ncbi:glycosyltransferase [Lichenifustis flavocetrariae]|uniref:Glycosyltransferase n=1 Tax=Lichenifustis flavocetrariae TaxID=2949735 RepID=A0AA41YUS3_9HYPH|nr:glycosyltransferase [Lichenifustis flavocetrariae]MCW6507417.1 glycosyltransferase [Lichenifustis flavocetrariae]
MSQPLSALALQQVLAQHFDHLAEVNRDEKQPGPIRKVPLLAVVIPCRNEESTIAQVVADFRQALPEARIAVFDNASTDETSVLARAAGAEVFREARPGKGHVVRRMFADVEADIYLMADGDGTYDAASARRLVDLVACGGYDMVVGARADIGRNAHRRGHAVGNRLFNHLYGRLFGAEFGDIFSGYRAFSRRFVKSFPALSSGFEIETELSVHARQLKLATAEVLLPYCERVNGSVSKLRTFRDGLRILGVLLYLLKETRPMLFFGLPAALTALLAAVLSIPLFDTYLTSGTVPRLPTAVLCTGLSLGAALLAVCGIILDSVARGRAEQKRMLFLAVSQTRI